MLVSFVLDAFMGELEAEADKQADKQAAGCVRDEDGGPGFGSRGHAIQVFDGSVLADSTDVQGVLVVTRHCCDVMQTEVQSADCFSCIWNR